jgi:predicted O-methyltransferase YrrM
MTENLWRDVDAFFAGRLGTSDDALDMALAANADAGLPAIDVSAAQGKLLELLVRMSGARRVLEIGTLGGYSTIRLARGVTEGGRVVTLEVDPRHAAVAQANLARAGVAERVDIRVGKALETLPRLAEEGAGPFDFVFVDADKRSNPDYLAWAVKLGRPGTTIVVDNVVRDGRILDETTSEADIVGTRALFDAVAADPRLSATAIQTVGSKGWDGFVLAILA